MVLWMQRAALTAALICSSLSAVSAQSLLPSPTLSDSGPAAPVRETTHCLVSRIVDGDTFECAGIGRVRPIGIDTPELSQAPYGVMATQALHSLMPVGTIVELEPDVEPRDAYGRTLAYVWSNGRLVNWMLVRRGWAVVTTYPPNVQYVDPLNAAQRLAREERVGLWALNAFDCLPGDRRRGRCE